MTMAFLRLHIYDFYRGKHEVYVRLLIGTQVNVQ
jgi:hypothetical protein